MKKNLDMAIMVDTGNYGNTNNHEKEERRQMENSGNNFMLKRIQKIKEKQSTFSYKLYLVMKKNY